MTVIIEFALPILVKPFYFKSRQMYRVGWLFLAISILRIPYKEWLMTPKEWIVDGVDVLEGRG